MEGAAAATDPRRRLRSVWLLCLAAGGVATATPALAVEPLGSEFQVNSYTTSFQGSSAIASSADGDVVVVWHSEDGIGDLNYSIQGQRYDASGSPLGAQFQVNTHTTGVQYFAEVAMEPGGDFVVVWTSLSGSGSDTSSISLHAQRYSAAGTPQGGQFQVNTYTTGAQARVEVASEADGDFVVVWDSAGSSGDDNDGTSIQGQRFDASGNPVGAEFQVNTYTTADQKGAHVGLDAAGNFVVVWWGPDFANPDVRGRRYDASGNPLGAEFQVNSYTTGFQWFPSVGVGADGDFVVAWHGHGAGAPGEFHVHGQRYDAGGASQGSEFQISQFSASGLVNPKVAMEPDGDFVVAWYGNGGPGDDTDGSTIQARRFAAAGTPVGDQFQVNSYTTGGQISPDVAIDDDGHFVATWSSPGSFGDDDSDGSVQAQRYSSADAGPALAAPKLGGQFQVNTYTTGYQKYPRVGVDADGGFAIVWESAGGNGTDDSSPVLGQRYDAGGNSLGAEFQVNTLTTGGQFRPSIDMDPTGRFVVVWYDFLPGPEIESSGQRFDASGMPQGAQFQVNTYTTLGQTLPNVALDDDGDFVVAWSGAGTGDTGVGVQAQRYDVDGVAQGAEFLVNTFTTGNQQGAEIAARADGAFVVVWESKYQSTGTDSDDWSVRGQLFDAAGTAVGDEFQANTYTTGSQFQPAVAFDGDGGFVVAWESGPGGYPTPDSIRVQRYDAAGSAFGGELLADSFAATRVAEPRIAGSADGGFVVVWESEGSPGSDDDGDSVQVQRFDRSGSPLGPQFQVNTYTTGGQNTPAVETAPDGSFVVAWSSAGSAADDDSGRSVQAQRYAAPAAHWRFEEGVGAFAFDSEGHGNTGAITGADFSVDAPALPGGEANAGALLFDAQSEYVEVPAGAASTNLNLFPNGLTVEAAIKPATLPIPPDTFGDREKAIVWASDSEISLALESSGGSTDLVAVLNQGGACEVSASGPFPGGTSAFSGVVISYADEVLRIYADGLELAQASAPGGCGSSVGPLDGAGIFRIGSDQSLPIPFYDHEFRGVIDEVRVTGAALDPSQFLFPPSAFDSDGDGLSNDVETDTGTFVDENDTGTDPLNPDSDADGLSDGDEVNAGTDPTEPDSDADGICDGGQTGGGACTAGPDNCPLVSNLAQQDSGGIGTSSPDGIGDLCQCGDVTGDGRVDASDYQVARERLVGATLSGPFEGKRCNLLGPPAGDASGDDCDVADLAGLDRLLGTSPSGVPQTACDAWFGL